VKEVGSFNPKPYVREKLEVGETVISPRTSKAQGSEDGRHGDGSRNPSPVLAGFKEIHPMVFSGITPSTQPITSISRRTWASCS